MEEHLANRFQLLVELHNAYLDKGSLSVWGDAEKESIKNNFTYHTNKIEGLTLTYGETLKFLKTSIVLPGMKMKDVYDLKNHKSVLEKIFSLFEKTELTEQTIKSLHGELMKDDAQWEVQDALMAPAGEYKTENNFTYRPGRQGEKVYLDYREVPKAIQKLIAETTQKLEIARTWTKGDDFQNHPLSAISDFHYEFLQIHPFSDGNGRMARLLTTLLLLQHKLPPIIITNEERLTYFQALIDSEKDSIHSPIIAFFVEKSIHVLHNKFTAGSGIM